MSTEIRVGVAGLSHGHVGGLVNSWKGVEGARLVAVADPTPLLDQYKKDFERSYTSWKEMFDKEKLDAVVVTSNNVESAEIAVQALGMGLPCMVEKAMAANYADAKRMLDAQKASGKTLMINWPFAWSPWIHELKKEIDAKSVGDVFSFNFRTGHHGPKEIGCDQWFVAWLYDEKLNGGGAIADFCCYGAAMCRWYFGLPDSVYCVKKNYTKDYDVVDDHALCVLKYPKMTAVIEGTWAVFGFDPRCNPVAYGKQGTLGVLGNKVVRYAAGEPETETESPALPIAGPAEYFWKCIQSGKGPEGVLDPVIAADACRILDAANKSAKSGADEKV